MKRLRDTASSCARESVDTYDSLWCVTFVNAQAKNPLDSEALQVVGAFPPAASQRRQSNSFLRMMLCFQQQLLNLGGPTLRFTRLSSEQQTNRTATLTLTGQRLPINCRDCKKVTGCQL